MTIFLELRIQWLRARARHGRWSEEVILTSEEMRRYVHFMTSLWKWWKERAPIRTEVSKELDEGLHAYAQKQALLRDALAQRASFIFRVTPKWQRDGIRRDRMWFKKEVDLDAAPPSMFSGLFVVEDVEQMPLTTLRGETMDKGVFTATAMLTSE